MNKYAFFVFEHNVVRYVVEAENKTAAADMLTEWIDKHTDQVSYDMERSFSGWDIEYDEETDEAPDITKG